MKLGKNVGSLLMAGICLGAPAFADQQSEETERVVMRHLDASHAGDASVVPRDYAEDAVVIFGNEATVGVAYVVWTMGDLRGSDTFIVQGGKIVAQTGVVFAPPRE